MEFEGINYIPTITMEALAPKGELNHSNNPTFVKYNFTSGSFNHKSILTFLMFGSFSGLLLFFLSSIKPTERINRMKSSMSTKPFLS